MRLSKNLIPLSFIEAIERSRLLVLVSLGAGLEYYDFVVYSMLSPYLNKAFFPDHSQFSSFQSFGLFAVGYLARPIGGLIFGSLGDQYGRKTVFTRVMLIMAVSTLIIGALPTFDQIGSSAGILLIICRFIQGLSFGGELPGALTVIAENTVPGSRGKHCGILMSSVGFGSILASLVLQILSSAFSEHQIVGGAWRLPFIVGGILAAVSFLIRKFYQEDQAPPLKSTSPVFELLKSFPLESLLGLMIVLFPACLIIFMLYAPEYFSGRFGFELPNVYLFLTLGTVWSSLLLPITGMIVDKIKPKRALLSGALLFCVFTFPLFYLLVSLQGVKNNLILFLFLLSYQTWIALLTISYMPLLVDTFPRRVRYTGFAFCYNCAYVIAGLTPGIFNYAFKWGYSHSLVFGVHCALAIFAVVAALVLCRMNDNKMNGNKMG